MFNMINEKDIYAHLSKGGDPQVLFDAFLQELNAAQQKVDAEKEMKKKAEAEAAAKKAAEKEAKATEEAKKASKRKTDAREAVVAAFTSYIALVLGEEISEDIIRASIIELEESIDAIKKISVSINGDELKSIFDLFA